MKLRELLHLLSNLPLNARDKDVYIDTGGEEFYDFTVTPLQEEGEEIMGYVFERIVHYDDPRQMKLPLGED